MSLILIIMKALLDTNIIIHREAPVVVHQDIGLLFNWFDRLDYEKCIHPVSIDEIKQHENEKVRRSFAAKVASYRLLMAPAPMTQDVQALSDKYDRSVNDINDSKILNELYSGRVDIIISEDRKLARKASLLALDEKVFTIDGFLEKVTSENPDLTEYKVLSVRKALFGHVNIDCSFFDSFRREYPDFNNWFNRKAEEPGYVCFAEEDRLLAFLYLKVEDDNEPYADIYPRFLPKRRLKIGTLKVELNGFKLGERFLKIVFDNAIKQRVDEIYVTIFQTTSEQERLVSLLIDYGFYYHGEKQNSFGNESVFVRDMTPSVNVTRPCLSFPYFAESNRAFLVPIKPEYHTELLPDSILRTESPDDFVELQPHRNSIQKVYVSRSYFRDLAPGDIIVFYRTGGRYISVVTTIGIIDSIYHDIKGENHFVSLCRKRSVFSDDELRKQWQDNRNGKPFIVNFLYAYSFPKRPNMDILIRNGVIRDVQSGPRGFERISHEQFKTILRLSESDTRIVVG